MENRILSKTGVKSSDISGEKSTFLYAAFIFIMVINLFGPNLLGRNYLGLISVLAMIAYALVFSDLYVNETISIMLMYALVITIIDIGNFLIYPTSYGMILRVMVYNLIPLLAFMTGTYFKERKVQPVFVGKVILGIGFAEAVVGILQVHVRPIRIFTLTHYADFEKYNRLFETWRVGRVVGTIGNPNTFGVFIVIFILFIYNVLLQKEKMFTLKYNVLIVVTLISLYALSLAQSRTAFALLLAGMIASLLMQKKGVAFKIGGIAILPPVLYIAFTRGSSMMGRFFNANTWTFGGRVPIWQNFISEHLVPIDLALIIGYGSIYVRDIGKSVDNYYLQVLLEYGMIGLLLYALVFVRLLYVFAKHENNMIKNFVISSFIVYLVADFTGSITMDMDIIIFFFLILGFYQPERMEGQKKFHSSAE